MCTKKKTTSSHPTITSTSPFIMARDEVDPSLITNDPHKRKLPSYATNNDNISADKNEVIKRMKKNTDDPSQACEDLIIAILKFFETKFLNHLKQQVISLPQTTQETVKPQATHMPKSLSPKTYLMMKKIPLHLPKGPRRKKGPKSLGKPRLLTHRRLSLMIMSLVAKKGSPLSHLKILRASLWRLTRILKKSKY